VVQPGGPRPRPQTHFPHLKSSVARSNHRTHRRMTPEGDRTWRADAALAGNTLIWGSTFVLVQAALKDITPILFLAIRFSIATVALGLLFRGRAQFRPTRGGMIAGGCLFAG